MENNKFLREELKDEALDAVAGGKKSNKKKHEEALKKQAEAYDRAQPFRGNNGRAF